ncbi:MAG: hypothetical protein IT292_06935 [Deltaproteobacteria bacterium]|nr:hypothetical protein [Deltaproteobacteria bacterium]
MSKHVVKKTAAKAKQVSKKQKKQIVAKSSAKRRPTARQKQTIKALAARKAKAAKVKKPKKIDLDSLILDHRDNGRRLSRSLLRKWNVNIEPEEINSIVDFALCDAASRFRTDKGASFMTFFFYHLRGHLVRLIAEASSNSSMFISSATSSGVDLGDYSALAPTMETNGFCDVVTTRQKISESPEELLLKKEELVNCQSHLNQLDKLEQTIVARLYASDEPLNKIARTLGYSRCHISRVKKSALGKLKKLLENSPLYHIPNTSEKVAVLATYKARKRARRKAFAPTASPLAKIA